MEAELKTKLDEMGRAWTDFQDAHKTLKKEIETLGTKDAVLEEHIKKASEKVAEIHAELTSKFEDIATKLNRISTVDPDEEKSERKAKKQAKKFARMALSLKGQLRGSAEVTPEMVKEFEYCSSEKFANLYIRKGKEFFGPEEQKALSVGTDLDGGFFVRPVWSNRIITKIFESSPIRQLATVETVTGPELKYPTDVGEADCGWVAETQSRAVTATPPVQEKSIVAHELYALPKATQSILEDAGVDVEAWLMDKVANKFARTEATAFVTGDGVGKPRGILTYPNGQQWGQIQQVGTGTSGQFTVTGLTNMIGQLKEVYHANARWLFRRESIPSIMLLQDGAGRYIFQPIFTLGYNNTPLLGYPITYAHDLPLSGAGAMAGVFGDLRAAYTIVDRLGITMLRDPYLYKPFIGFYTRKRVGGDVLNFEAYKILVQS